MEYEHLQFVAITSGVVNLFLMIKVWIMHNREKQILNYHLCEQLKDENINMAKLVDKLVGLSIHKAWEEKPFASKKHLLQNALTDLMSAQSSFNKFVGHVDLVIKAHRSAERRKKEV